MIGREGIALMGQIMNFSTIMFAIGSAGVLNGVTKYVAENRDEKALGKYIQTAFFIVTITSAICGISVIVLNSYVAKLILHDSSLGYVFIFLGVSIILYSINNLILAIVNGFQNYRSYVFANIAESIIGLVFSLALVFFWELKGALVAIVTFQSAVLLSTLLIVRKQVWMRFVHLKIKLEGTILKKYSRYSLMTLVTAFTVPVAQLMIRGFLLKKFSVGEAGIWEACNRLSNAYLLVFTTVFSVYYLPQLSITSNETSLRKEIAQASRIFLPLAIGSAAAIYLLRSFIIPLLFSVEFREIESFIIYQLVGDTLKISSFLLAFIMIAKSMTRTFIVTEIFFSLSYVLFAMWLGAEKGASGVVKAYALNYLLYLFVMVVLFRKIVFKR